MSIAIAMMFAGVAGVLAWSALNAWSERVSAEQAMARAVGDEVTDERELVLAASRKDRLFVPVLGGLSATGHRITPIGFRDKAAKQLRAAGRGTEEDLDKYLAMRTLGIAAIPFTTFVVIKFLGFSPKGLGIAALLGLALSVLPASRISREVAARQKAIARSLPDILDLLVISVEAGLGFEQALDRTVASVPGELSLEFARMLGETRAGVARSDALRALGDRVDVPEVRSFVLAIIQADTFGVSVGQVLRSQAEEMRIKRRQLAHERAQKAPVKMLIPMVFCIFPSIFIVIIGPAIINLVHNFK
jgi:tight adherence protein C